MEEAYEKPRFNAGYALSNYSKCRGCRKYIQEGNFRLSERVRTHICDKVIESWYHEECFFRKNQLPNSVVDIDNFINLKFSDQTRIRNRIDAVAASSSRSSTYRTNKRKSTANSQDEIGGNVPVTGENTKEELDHEEPLKKFKVDFETMEKQNDKLQYFLTVLDGLERDELLELLKANNQYEFYEKYAKLKVLADGLAFGALDKCPKCTWGQLVIENDGYRCIAIDEYIRCNAVFQNPPRKLFIVPENLQEKLKDYKCTIETRVLYDSFKNEQNKSQVSELSNGSSSTAALDINSNESSHAVKLATVEVRNNSAVDPRSKKQWVSRVYQEYSVYLTRPNIIKMENPFYILQILESNPHYYKQCFWLFRSWGRIGVPGGFMETEYLIEEDVVKAFKKIFSEKTGNEWGHKFVNQPKKYRMTDVSYQGLNFERDYSIVDKSVEHLIRSLEIEDIPKVLMEWKYDLNTMPLGKLSPNAIDEAFNVLVELENHLNTQVEVDRRTVMRCTHKFYEIIPHAVGNKNLPELNSLKIIEEKTKLLIYFTYIEVLYSKEKFENSLTFSKKIEYYYNELHTNLQPVKTTDPEFETLKLYFENGAYHEKFNLAIVQVFKVARHGEDERFTPFEKLSNRMLLWHGTEKICIPGILTKGFIIFPIAKTGSMFGRGIYFADRVGKSAQHYYTNVKEGVNGEVAMLLLCEVALGNKCGLTVPNPSLTKAPDGFDSVAGLGRNEPDPIDNQQFESNVMVPLGRTIPSIHGESVLKYNEFVVYDVNQIRIRYLFQVELTWKSPS